MVEETDTTELGDLIRETRKRQGLSATQLGDQIGHHWSTITKIERGGTKQPKPKILEDLSAKLGLELAELYRLAGYRIPDVPFDVSGFLHVKHRDLPERDIRRIADIVDHEVTTTRQRMKHKHTKK